MPDNVNQRITDLLLEHDIDLMRVEASTEAEIERAIHAITLGLIAGLAKTDPTEPVRMAYKRQRLSKLLVSGQKTIREQYRRIYRNVRQQLLDVMREETGAFTAAVNQGIGVELMQLPSLAGSGLRAIIDERVITANVNDAATMRAFFEREAASHFRRFEGTLQQGFAAGDNLGQLITRLREIEGIIQREATGIARSAYNHVLNNLRIEMMQRNSNLFRGVIHISILDGNTTPICIGLSNGMWDINTGRPLPESPVQRPYPGPPGFHFACRSHHYPLTKSNRQIGRGSNRARRALERLPKEQRDLLNIDPPAQESYPDWLKRQPKQVQIDKLGPARYKLWIEGKLNLRELTTQKGRPLTLKELARRREAA